MATKKKGKRQPVAILDGLNCAQYDNFALAVLRSNLNAKQYAAFTASSTQAQELLLHGLSHLCERAFMLKKTLERKQRTQSRLGDTLGRRIDDYADWNTLRRILRHGAATQEFLGLRMEEAPPQVDVAT